MSHEDEFIRGIDKLIPRPEIALAVMTLANDGDCQITTLSNKIKQDPSLMANMLRLANSAYFGHMKEINSIADIVVRLGLDTVKMLAITSASIGILKTPQEMYNLEPGALWQHSYATALLSSIIGRYARCQSLSTLYTAALLHDIGKIILNKPLQTESMNSGEEYTEGSLIDFEHKLLHTDHARVGMVLLQNWGLPEEIISPIGHHHDKDISKLNDLNCRIVYLANFITESIGIKAVIPEDCLFRVEEASQEIPQMDFFNNNMEDIIEEFFEKFNESDTLEFS